jgi:general stress protein 26
MAEMTIKNLSDKMAKIDFAMFTTCTDGGAFASRPMSNNGEVEYQGDSYYFTYDTARTVSDVSANPNVTLAFQGSTGLLGAPGIFIAVQAQATLIRDKAAFSEHWNAGLDRWFPQGVDTPGLVMIKARASRIHYWDGEDEGELRV